VKPPSVTSQTRLRSLRYEEPRTRLKSDNGRFHTLHRPRGTVCHRRFNNYLTLRLLNRT